MTTQSESLLHSVGETEIASLPGYICTNHAGKIVDTTAVFHNDKSEL